MSYSRRVKLGGDQMGLAHRWLGGIYWGRKEYKRAADEIETYLKLTPKAADAEQIARHGQRPPEQVLSGGAGRATPARARDISSGV